MCWCCVVLLSHSFSLYKQNSFVYENYVDKFIIEQKEVIQLNTCILCDILYMYVYMYIVYTYIYSRQGGIWIENDWKKLYAVFVLYMLWHFHNRINAIFIGHNTQHNVVHQKVRLFLFFGKKKLYLLKDIRRLDFFLSWEIILWKLYRRTLFFSMFFIPYNIQKKL